MDGWMDGWMGRCGMVCGVRHSVGGGWSVEYVGTLCTVWRYLSISLGTCFT